MKTVDSTIVEIILPKVYASLDEVLSLSPNLPKDVLMRARALLPPKYANSISNKGMKP